MQECYKTLAHRNCKNEIRQIYTEQEGKKIKVKIYKEVQRE